MLGRDEVESRFGFHKATIEGDNATLPRHALLRKAYKEFANRLDEVLEDGRAKDLAFDHLEASSMWSHKAVAQDSPLIDER